MELYCLDTNIFIEAWTKYYPFDLVPTYWEIIENLARQGKVFITYEVYKEILKQDDELTHWIKEREMLFVRMPDQQVQRHLAEIMRRFPKIINIGKHRSAADPWIIAHAIATNATVVTKETPSYSLSKPRIPDVCNSFEVRWFDDFDFIREIGISFTAHLKKHIFR